MTDFIDSQVGARPTNYGQSVFVPRLLDAQNLTARFSAAAFPIPGDDVDYDDDTVEDWTVYAWYPQWQTDLALQSVLSPSGNRMTTPPLGIEVTWGQSAARIVHSTQVPAMGIAFPLRARWLQVHVYRWRRTDTYSGGVLAPPFEPGTAPPESIELVVQVLKGAAQIERVLLAAPSDSSLEVTRLVSVPRFAARMLVSDGSANSRSVDFTDNTGTALKAGCVTTSDHGVPALAARFQVTNSGGDAGIAFEVVR